MWYSIQYNCTRSTTGLPVVLQADRTIVLYWYCRIQNQLFSTCEPILRLHSCHVCSYIWVQQCHDWMETAIGICAKPHCSSKTLQATTQVIPMIEAETREIMRDHCLQTRLPQLKVRHVNDQCYVDMFFSSVPFVHSFRCWNLSALNIVSNWTHRSQSKKEWLTSRWIP